MLEWAVVIGAFIRWIIKKCKTKLKDEIQGNFKPKFGGSYELENFFIGIAVVVVFFGVLILIFFH
jgi:hypothetical protein